MHFVVSLAGQSRLLLILVNLGMFCLIRERCGPLQTHGARVQSAVEGQCVTWGSVLHCCEFKGKQCGSDVWRTGRLSLLLSLGPHANP